MKIYLKGYYGYQNFGDELFFFEVVRRIFEEHPLLEELTIEVGDKKRMEKRIHMNQSFIDNYYKADKKTGIDWNKIQLFEPPKGKRKISWQIQTFLWYSKFRNYFKIFWGWEVIDENRPFPHNGRNIPILYWYSVLTKNFSLWGGFGAEKKRSSRLLKNLLFSQAKYLLARDSISYKSAKKKNPHTKKTEDFCLPLLIFFLDKRQKKRSDSSLFLQEKSILINLTEEHKKSNLPIPISDTIEKLIFFPWDLNRDGVFYKYLKKTYPQLELYDWTQFPLVTTFNCFLSSKLGIGYRLHFLYPLMYFWVEVINLSENQKTSLMINNIKSL